MKNEDILPFCIYHYFEEQTEAVYGYLGLPEKVRRNGEISFHCSTSKNGTDTKWKFNSSFYAIEPSFRPIPSGMKIFCVETNSSFPYDSLKLKVVYDPFTIASNCVYFITYIKPVPNTIPLYFFKKGIHLLPSFEKTPPSSEWVEDDLSPIFVMTTSTVGDLSVNKTLNFNCINGRCIPWVNSIPDVYGDNNSLFELNKCVLYCNELTVTDNKSGEPLQLIDRIALQTYKKRNFTSFIRKVSLNTVMVILSLFIVILILLVYALQNKIQR
jgi:hypothetical protein